MSIDILDVVFRFERNFGIKISGEQISKMACKNDPPDITVGEMFDLVSRKAFLAGSFDEEMDENLLWPIFQGTLVDALGVEPDEVTKDKWLNRDLGMW